MKITREILIEWIKEHDKFYADAALDGLDYERLVKIYKEIENSKKFIQKTVKDE